MDYSDIVNSEEIRRAVRRQDKLNYRILIQNKIDACLRNLGKSEPFYTSVEALKSAVYFDVPGLPFRTDIDSKLKELKDEYLKAWEPIISDRNICFHPLKRAFFGEDIRYSYYYNLMEFLINLMAKHDALISAKDFVETGESDF